MSRKFSLCCDLQGTIKDEALAFLLRLGSRSGFNMVKGYY